MTDISGKRIAELAINLHINLIHWNKLHMDEVFSIKGEEGKLTLQQFNLLMHINDFGINTVSEIASAMCISKSTASLGITKLVKRGYLMKQAPAKDDDGRKIYFHLTDKGTKVLKTTENTLMEMASSYFDSFDDEKKLALATHLYKINQLISTGGTVK